MQPNVQTSTLLNVIQKQDSTHGVAPQASAAILIRMLRCAYNIQTYLLTDHSLLAETVAKNIHGSARVETTPLSPPLEEKQAAVLSKEATQGVEDCLKSQSSLLDYLTTVIEALEKEDKSETSLSVAEQNHLNHPDIQGTIELINRVLQLPLYTKNEKKYIFKQMHSIAKTCPGLQWDKKHAQWSTNSVYIEGKTVQVTASPAETLNLVCRAILDDSRYSKDQQNDTEHRIISLCAYCLSLQLSVEQGQHEICSTGRQHGLLFLLNHSYLDKSNTQISATPVKLNIDTDAFLLGSVTNFLIHTIHTLSEDKQNQLILDWLLYQNDLLECKIVPVIAFLRQKFPMPALNPEGKTQDMDADARWKDECIQFLVTQCREHGLNPNKLDLGKMLVLEELSCPVIKGSSTPILQEILNAPILLRDASFTLEMNELINLRNHVLDRFRCEIRNQAVQTPREAAMHTLYVALQFFNKLYHYRHLTVFIGADEAAFFAISNELQGVLVRYFKGYQFNQHVLDEFACTFQTVRLSYSQLEKQFREKSHTDMIENFFAKLQGPADIEAAFKRLEVLKPEGSLVNPFIFLNDETLERWYTQNLSVIEGQSTLELSSYEINRILLHALTVPIMAWSPHFSKALALVTQWLLVPGTTVLLTAFKQSYQPMLLCNLSFVFAVKDNISLEQNIKNEFAQAVHSVNLIYYNLIWGLKDALPLNNLTQIVESFGNHKIFNQEDVMGSTPLMYAALRGFDDVVKLLISIGVDINQIKFNKLSALLIAIQQGHLAVVQELLKSENIDVNLAPGGISPLYRASESGRVDFVNLLISKGANPNQLNKGISALNIAVFKGHLDVVRELLKCENIDVNQESNGASPLFYAANFGRRDLVNLLISKGASLNQLTNKLDSPLLIAVQKGHLDVVQELLNNENIDVNQAPGGISLLCRASEKGHVGIVNLLISKGVNPNQLNNGYSALTIAVNRGHFNVVQELLKCENIEVNQESEGESPLFHAAKMGQRGIVNLLISKGANVNQMANKLYSPLLIAVQRGHLDVIKELLNSENIDVNQASANISPLFEAIAKGRDDIVNLLISRGFSPNQIRQNCCPLLFAVHKGHLNVVQELLNSENIDVNQSSNGQSPLHLAAENDRVDIVSLLISKGASINVLDNQQRSPLLVAVQKGHFSVVQELLNSETIDLNQGPGGTSPLYIAAENGRVDIVNLLISKGANINQLTTKELWSPLYKAVYNGHLNVVQELLKSDDIDIDKEQNLDLDSTLLDIAAEYDHYEIFHALIQKGFQSIRAQALFEIKQAAKEIETLDPLFTNPSVGKQKLINIFKKLPPYLDCKKYPKINIILKDILKQINDTRTSCNKLAGQSEKLLKKELFGIGKLIKTSLSSYKGSTDAKKVDQLSKKIDTIKSQIIMTPWETKKGVQITIDGHNTTKKVPKRVAKIWSIACDTKQKSKTALIEIDTIIHEAFPSSNKHSSDPNNLQFYIKLANYDLTYATSTGLVKKKKSIKYQIHMNEYRVKDGITYSMLGLDDSVLKGALFWDELPPEFPKTGGSHLKLDKLKWTPILLEVILRKNATPVIHPRPQVLSSPGMHPPTFLSVPAQPPRNCQLDYKKVEETSARCRLIHTAQQFVELCSPDRAHDFEGILFISNQLVSLIHTVDDFQLVFPFFNLENFQRFCFHFALQDLSQLHHFLNTMTVDSFIKYNLDQMIFRMVGSNPYLSIIFFTHIEKMITTAPFEGTFPTLDIFYNKTAAVLSKLMFTLNNYLSCTQSNQPDMNKELMSCSQVLQKIVDSINKYKACCLDSGYKEDLSYTSSISNLQNLLHRIKEHPLTHPARAPYTFSFFHTAKPTKAAVSFNVLNPQEHKEHKGAKRLRDLSDENSPVTKKSTCSG
ncbi:MAG: ankyrin repeat domain-containing protein [Legionella sp.]|nr:ankyrin repeat domain-containing protein [Legionella sp.]